jgi:hypothetical protein
MTNRPDNRLPLPQWPGWVFLVVGFSLLLQLKFWIGLLCLIAGVVGLLSPQLRSLGRRSDRPTDGAGEQSKGDI